MITTDALIKKFQYALDNKFGYIYGASGGVWTAAKQAAATREQTIKYGAQWIGHHVADCSGLFSWAFKQLGGTMYHGSNTMWLKWCTSKGELRNGKRTDGKPLLPGTAVFTYDKEKDNRGHVGLYIGNGYVIEAAGTKSGVIKSKVTLSKWVEWGELKGVDYGASEPISEPADEPKDSRPTLRKGTKGDWVTLAQTALINKGYDLGKWGADGDFGSQTEKAVKEFQQDHGLTADGVIGQKTWDALEAQGTSLYTVTIPSLPKYKAEALVKNYTGASMKEEGR